MDFANSTWWWIACFAFIAAELLSGTFYLLMIALGFAAAAAISHTGASLSVQIVVAGLVAGGAVTAWHVYRQRHKSNRHDPVASDIGQIVAVNAWNADGTTTVQYRGAPWQAMLANPHAPQITGQFRITAMQGNRLLLTHINH